MKKYDKEIKMYLKPYVLEELNLKRQENEEIIDDIVILINRETTVGEVLDMQLYEMPIALHNFLNRRLDYVYKENEDKKLYYGHASNKLGYFFAEDEIINVDDV